MAVFVSYVIPSVGEAASTMFGSNLVVVPGTPPSAGAVNDAAPPVQTPTVGPDPGAAPGSPAGFPAAYVDARLVPLVIDVTDAGAGVAAIVLEASYISQVGPWVGVFKRGAFVPGWQLLSTVVAIANGWRLSIVPDGGWPPSVDGLTPNVWIDVVSVDRAGNVS